MAPFGHSVDIDRKPEDVFDYVTDPSHFTEWQAAVVSARAESDEPMQVGSRLTMTRRMGGREDTMTAELTDYTPPRTYGFRVIDGPVRAIGKGRMDPLDEGSRTRFTFEIDFEGHGIGKVLVPLVVRRQARKELLQTHEDLKRVLEGGAGTT